MWMRISLGVIHYHNILDVVHTELYTINNLGMTTPSCLLGVEESVVCNPVMFSPAYSLNWFGTPRDMHSSREKEKREWLESDETDGGHGQTNEDKSTDSRVEGSARWVPKLKVREEARPVEQTTRCRRWTEPSAASDRTYFLFTEPRECSKATKSRWKHSQTGSIYLSHPYLSFIELIFPIYKLYFIRLFVEILCIISILFKFVAILYW